VLKEAESSAKVSAKFLPANRVLTFTPGLNKHSGLEVCFDAPAAATPTTPLKTSAGAFDCGTLLPLFEREFRMCAMGQLRK
jgi:hypothetical protein